MNCREAIDVMDHVLDDTLQPALKPGFRDHMTTCVPCRIYFEQLQITVKALRRLPREEAKNPRRGDLLDEFSQESGRDPE
jgi:hypothetical protein